MNKIIRLYHTLFYCLFKFYEAIAKEGWEHWKAFISICLIHVIILIQSLVWFTVTTGIKITLQRPFVVPILLGFILTWLNYFGLLHQNKWKVINAEFEILSKRFHNKATWLSLLFIISALLGLVLSFICLSKQLKYN